MSINLHGRNILSLEALTPAELRFLVQLASDLKAAKRSGSEHRQLYNRNLALIFQDEMPFLRASFEVAAHDQGAHVTCLALHDYGRETVDEIRKMAGMLGRMFDAIQCCGLAGETTAAFAEQAGVPVYSGQSQEGDPCQVVADFQTMREFTHKHLSDVTLSVVGNGRASGARSLAMGAAKVGMDFRLVTPKDLWPDQPFIDRAKSEGWKNGGKFTVFEDIAGGVLDADFVYAGRWFCHDDGSAHIEHCITQLTPFSVRMATLEATGNPHVKFMQDVPDFVGRDDKRPGPADRTDAAPASRNVLESKASIILDQAENRMHATKAILLATLAR